MRASGATPSSSMNARSASVASTGPSSSSNAISGSYAGLGAQAGRGGLSAGRAALQPAAAPPRPKHARALTLSLRAARLCVAAVWPTTGTAPLLLVAVAKVDGALLARRRLGRCRRGALFLQVAGRAAVLPAPSCPGRACHRRHGSAPGGRKWGRWRGTTAMIPPPAPAPCACGTTGSFLSVSSYFNGEQVERGW